MDIACPNCAATYRVPEALLAQGKALRCAACGHEWVPKPAEVPPEPPATRPAEADVAPPPEPPAPLAQRPPPPTTPPPLQRRTQPGQRFASAPARPSGRLLPLAWLASVTFLLLALLTLVMFGEAVATAWPPFARITALING